MATWKRSEFGSEFTLTSRDGMELAKIKLIASDFQISSFGKVIPPYTYRSQVNTISAAKSVAQIAVKEAITIWANSLLKDLENIVHG